VGAGAPAAGAGWRQVVVDDKGSEREFDRVVFACPAPFVDSMLRPASWLERTLLRGVGYFDELYKEDCRDWLEAQVHQDPSCLPELHRGAVLEHAAFLIDVDEAGRDSRDGSGKMARNVEFTHNLGAFPPGRASGGPAAPPGAADTPATPAAPWTSSRRVGGCGRPAT